MIVNLKTYGIIEVELKPGESFLGERGSMAFCDGDILYQPFGASVIESVKRFLGGESIFPMVNFSNNGKAAATIKLRYDILGKTWHNLHRAKSDILVLNLLELGGDFTVHPGCFFAATSGVNVGCVFDFSLGRSVFGFGRLIQQKLVGNGTVFLKKDRLINLEIKTLALDQVITVDPVEIFGYSTSALKTKSGFSMKSFLVGEGFSSYTFKGPGTLYTYSQKPR